MAPKQDQIGQATRTSEAVDTRQRGILCPQGLAVIPSDLLSLNTLNLGQNPGRSTRFPNLITLPGSEDGLKIGKGVGRPGFPRISVQGFPFPVGATGTLNGDPLWNQGSDKGSGFEIFCRRHTNIIRTGKLAQLRIV